MPLYEPQSKWLELPLDILVRLAKLVSTTSNTITFSWTIQLLLFRAVCKSWRSALPLDRKYDDALVFCHNPISISAPPPSFFGKDRSGSSEYYNLARVSNGSFYFVRSTTCIFQSIKNPSCSRLLTVDHLSDDFRKVCCRRQLFTSYNRSNDWDISSPRCLNLLDYRVSVVAEEYSLRFLVNDKGVLRLQDSDDIFWRKAVVICNMKFNEDLDGVAVVLLGDEVLRQYTFADRKWTTVNIHGKWGFGQFSFCHDIVRFDDGCIAAIDDAALISLLSYDFKSRTLGCTRHATELKLAGLDCRRIVVSSDTGELYLVEKNAFRDEFEKPKVSFTIRRFSDHLKSWVRLHNTPGLIMFVGGDSTFSTSGKRFPMISSGNGNCMFTSTGSFRRREYFSENEFFVDIADDRCVFHFGEFCADSISNSNFIWCKNDYNPIFSSPENWEELNQLPSHCPQRLLEQPAVPMAESKSDTNSGGYRSLPEDVNIGCESREKLTKDKGNKCRADNGYGSDHSESSYKSRKIAHSEPSTEHMGTKEVQLELIQNLVACVTRLISKPCHWLAPLI